MDIQTIANLIGIVGAILVIGLFIWCLISSIRRSQWDDAEIDREVQEEYEYQQRLKRFMEDE